MSDDLLRALLLKGPPDPLADLCTGTHAIIDSSSRTTVFSALPDNAWTSTAHASWPTSWRAARTVWAAIAPAENDGVVVVNLSVVDISALPDPVQWCLRMQNARHGLRAVGSAGGRPRAVLRNGVLTFTGFDRIVRIGAPYTATQAAYLEQAEAAFEFLSPALQTVARVIAQCGPISRVALAAEVYGNPTNKDCAALEMTLTRLRQHPRVRLDRGVDGLLTIAAVSGGESSSDEAAEAS